MQLTKSICLQFEKYNIILQNMYNSEKSTDILRLFREDINPSERVDAFRVASEQLREEIDTIATPENIDKINDNFDLILVFNSHGDSVHTGQSLEHLKNKFITFVENAGDAEIRESGLFGLSLSSAFNKKFNNQEASRPLYNPSSPQDFGYWRDRGLLEAGSIIAPVDIRHYSRRLLDALMGNDYDQQFLNRSVPGFELRSKELDVLLENQGQRGLLVMYSNSVRELTSTKQVMETLLQLLNTEEGGDDFGEINSDKMRALIQKSRVENGKIPVGVMYGTAHHALFHLYKGLGIECDRVFPGKEDAPGHLSFSGSILDQFFSSHAFGIDENRINKYASQLVLEGMLWEVIDNNVEYGLVPKNRDVVNNLFRKISKTSRDQNILDNLPEIHENFRVNPLSVLPILESAGVYLIKI